VNATPTKPGRPGTGLGYLSYAAASRETRPWFVTGGVTPETVPAMAAAGARRFVVVRYLTEATDPEAAAARLRTAISALLAVQPADQDGDGSGVVTEPVGGP
jgi:thiamine-phosphate pyrophosphorylase